MKIERGRYSLFIGYSPLTRNWKKIKCIWSWTCLDPLFWRFCFIRRKPKKKKTKYDFPNRRTNNGTSTRDRTGKRFTRAKKRTQIGQRQHEPGKREHELSSTVRSIRERARTKVAAGGRRTCWSRVRFRVFGAGTARAGGRKIRSRATTKTVRGGGGGGSALSDGLEQHLPVTHRRAREPSTDNTRNAGHGFRLGVK